MAHLHKLRAEIDQKMEAFFAEKISDTNKDAPEALPLAKVVNEFTMRRGKRVRPLMTIAGHSSITGNLDDPRLIKASLSVELLQSYLLIQDDWMDGDKLRRGKPSVHAGLLSDYPSAHTANSIAILVSDLASAFAEELLIDSGFESEACCRAMRSYSKMHQDVIYGQYLDVAGTGAIELVHHLKTASYTVTGPLLIGAELALANDEQRDTLRKFGDKLGLAFQLKDDLIGTFGKSTSTGKADDNDLKSGKRTALVDELLRRLDEREAQEIRTLFGQSQISDENVQQLRELMIDKEVESTIESKAQALSREAIEILDSSQLQDPGKNLLLELSEMLTNRKY